MASGIFGGAKRLLRDTAIEVFALAVLGAGIGGFAFHRAESNSAYAIPVGFSEIAEIEKAAVQEGEQVGPLTRYLTSTNDAVMKIFDAWNSSDKDSRTFTEQLERGFSGRSFGRSESLSYRLGQLDEQADAALGALGDFIAVEKNAAEAAEFLGQAWRASHQDHYTMDCEDVPDPDDEGTVEECHERYDSTTHSYRYYPGHGEAAAARLSLIADKYGHLRLNERLRTATVTTSQNELAAKQSRPSKEGKFTKEELLGFANEWKNGSTLSNNLPEIYGLNDALEGDARSWEAQKATAHSTSYETYSSSDAGPEEFRTAEKAMRDARQLHEGISEIIEGLEFTKSKAPLLEQKISQLIAVEFGQAEGSPRTLRNEIISTAKQMYTANFRSGFDVSRFRAWMTFAGIMAGTAVGAVLGYLLEKGENRFKWYDEKVRKSPDPRFGPA